MSMRGADQQQGHVFSYLSPEQRVRKDHPLRPIRAMVDQVLKDLSPEFSKMYSKVGRPSIPPEQLLRALLLQMLYSVRSERMLVEEIDYNILFRWFVGLNLDDEVWAATVFTKNRDRLLEAEVAKDFLGRRGGSAIDSRTTLHEGYALSQKKRKRIEECFGWLKTIALLRKVRHRGTLKVDWIFTFACAAYNLVRMRNLMRCTVPT
jgi:transposase